ncbi:YdiU family protein [Sphingomonas lacunae]|uniref:YdiU family protein n=1 Tax=Sphingomonas lacunae TaxID=2698828 RepID=A0A6M4ATD9_9SPHN|nr:YdiU family protein [Sphingomonas lacunae]QJQ31582.1 YdiU family protein [Sphingomonas lacunae]
MTPLTQAFAYHPDPAINDIADFIGDPVVAAAFPAHQLRWRNDRAAAQVGLDAMDDMAWVQHFGLFVPLGDNLPQPLALRYHGHQFGTYNPDLGDGRGFLFAQMRDDRGRLIDLGTKGSGQTPYSRFGDGRLTLKGAVRELLATEMLEALGVETSRTFSIIETGEQLHRGDEPSPTRSAVLVRMSHGHIRVGSFQRLAALDRPQEMERLLRYALTHYVGIEADEAAALPVDEAAMRLVRFSAERCARMAASYMVAGFVHGVLNTDNINISGESFDYGPWRFTQQWDPAFVAAYFDQQGLYAFGRQAQVIHWDVGQLVVSLRLIANVEAQVEALSAYAPAYERSISDLFCWRLGVSSTGAEADRDLVLAAERLMRAEGGRIDNFHVDWGGGRIPDGPDTPERAAMIAALAGRSATRGAWWETVPPQSMSIEEVEALWAPIAEADDWAPLYAKVDAVRAMGAALRGEAR